MSRRKQARPRHVDDPDLDSPAIAANPVVPVFPDDSSVDEDRLEKPSEDNEDFTGDLADNPKVGSPRVDAHVCGKCRAEFLDLEEFVIHKRECIEPEVLLHGDDKKTPEDQPELLNVNGVKSVISEGPDMENFEGIAHGEGLETEVKHDDVDPAADEVDASEDREGYENQSDYGNEIEDETNKSVGEEDEHEENVKEDKTGENKVKGEKTDVEGPSYMESISNLLTSMGAGSNSNVMLEPLEATKAAVAQFAENNLPEQERDVTRLQTALYSLQQQQLMQLQIIQQLQQQLVTGSPPNGQLPPSALNGQLPLAAHFPGLNLNLPVLPSFPPKTEESKSSSARNSPSPKSEHSAHEKERESVSEKSSPLQSMEMPPIGGSEISKLSALASSASTAMSGLSVTPGSSCGSASSLSSTPLDYRSSAKTGSDSRGFLAADDPFFKHKCRMCHKVFGSDSALQIHLRSHTDVPHHAFLAADLPTGLGAVLSDSRLWTCEKPFQCNICGGRFSTRGNLKVHFQRHKAEFPNVEMNPNPVPEHLDKSPMPLLGSPFPAAALTPFANPAFMGMQGLMNGFMFPPPHLATRLPMTGHGMLPKPSFHHEDRRTSSSPTRDLSKPSPHIKKEPSPAHSGTDLSIRRSPEMKDIAKIPPTISPSSIHMSKASPVLPISSMAMINNYPVMSPLPSHPPFSQHRPPVITPTSVASNDPFRTTMLPSSILENDDNLEQFMEIDKSETSKLQQLVDNIEHKLTDPNQCVICHRVLSCKSALQMHYRIHTGERPFKCKICGRSFTTKGNLKTHMGVHRAKPPLRMMHQCPVCHKQFTNLLVLQQHIRSHTGMTDLPTMPNFPNLNMFGRHHMEDPNMCPINMKRHYPEEYERELDLSLCKKPKLDKSHDEDKQTRREESHGDGAIENSDNLPEDVSEEEDEQDAMDDEANKQAAQEAKKEGLQRDDSEERTHEGVMYDGQSGKTPSRDSVTKPEDSMGFSNSVVRPPSPKYLQEDSNTDQDSSFNSYSASLAALEERVRAIDSTMACNPLSQFHSSPYLLGPDHYTNGDRGHSPKSESGSENGDKEGRKPSTPALSVSSEGSMGSNYMLGAMEVRPTDGLSKSGTMCNVCYKTFACRSALDIHYRSHTKERPYKCELCDRSFTTRGNMKQHLLTHKLENGGDGSELENNNDSCTPNQNDNDSDRSNDSSHFSESLKDSEAKESNESQGSNGKENTSPSQKPGATSSSSSTPVSASRSSSYTSPDSQSPFINKTPTVKHQCLVCQKGFSSASALQIHIRTHTGDKPFKCTVCGKAFTTKGNLKVHMGTHMWNNSPSRRGRRMSIEPPFMLSHKENPYLPHGFPPRPDFYPFQFPPFMNGLPTPPKSISEMSVMASMANSVGMKKELPSPHSDMNRSKLDRSPVPDDRPKFAESGELDLSMKSTGSSGSRSSEKTSPSSVDSNSSSGMVSPPHTSLGWGWKASCHFCSRTFPTTSALEHHVRSMHMIGDSLPKVGAS